MENIKRYNTLFLDRDGVINIQRKEDYVKSIEEFIFIEGVFEALSILSAQFAHIVIVTNQRGVGKGVMSLQQLEAIHTHMQNEISARNGKIDKIYFCTDTGEHSLNRKPNIGMALQAQREFPDINFSDSIMAGDSLSDMQFANNAGIPAVLIGNKYKPEDIEPLSIKGHYPDLLTFAKQFKKN
ncbi:MAG: HAD-IIIA family hydrolase [Tannerellaceae bacterium]|jgi:D-glycero-D-manno-heptose 1,7-bisphosphate phosphatase/D-glycero-alpha-D-manno-heptose 1-phosphate guanylyltransferase|nr:HAD-IIIA family hydrolase [Tannerellaceae bacterium]